MENNIKNILKYTLFLVYKWIYLVHTWNILHN